MPFNLARLRRLLAEKLGEDESVSFSYLAKALRQVGFKVSVPTLIAWEQGKPIKPGNLELMTQFEGVLRSMEAVELARPNPPGRPRKEALARERQQPSKARKHSADDLVLADGVARLLSRLKKLRKKARGPTRALLDNAVNSLKSALAALKGET